MYKQCSISNCICFPHVPKTILVQKRTNIRGPVNFTHCSERPKHIIALFWVPVIRHLYKSNPVFNTLCHICDSKRVPSTLTYAALPYTEYPLRMLKFQIRAEITEYDANGRAGLVQNDVFAKALRMLADPYKCL